MAKNDFDELMSVGVDIGKDVFTWLVLTKRVSVCCARRSSVWR